MRCARATRSAPRDNRAMLSIPSDAIVARWARRAMGAPREAFRAMQPWREEHRMRCACIGDTWRGARKLGYSENEPRKSLVGQISRSKLTKLKIFNMLQADGGRIRRG